MKISLRVALLGISLFAAACGGSKTSSSTGSSGTSGTHSSTSGSSTGSSASATSTSSGTTSSSSSSTTSSSTSSSTTSSSSSSSTTTSSTSSTTTSSTSTSSTSSSSSSGSTSGSTSSGSSGSSGSGSTASSSSSSSASSGSSSSSSSGSSGSSGALGTLEVDIATPDVDGGVVVDVEVAGPGFDGGLGASASLQVTPGVYDVLANLGITPDAIVSAGYVGTVAGSPATVVANQTQVVSVSYALLGGTGFVWLPSYADGNVYGFSAATLTAGNATPTPDVVLTTDAGSLGQAVAFDRAGTLWTTNSMGQIWGWQLYADGGAADPTVLQTVGTDGGPIFPQSMTFAPNGDLWMVMGNDDALAVVSASQLSQGGAVTLTELPGNSIPLDDGGAFLSLDLPYGVAFDSAGAVWVANIGANNPGNVGTLAKFALTPDGGFDPTPLAFLYSSQGVFNGPNGLSFDAQGNLWVADYAGNAVMRFDVSSASGLVDAQPVATLTTPGGVRAAPFNQPNYVTFDNSGALWLYNQRDSTLERFPDPLGYTGVVTPTPDLALSLGFGGDTGKFQFDLPAPGLGLYP